MPGFSFDFRYGPSGVYQLLLKGQVVYVGQSENVFGRIATHWVVMKRKKPPSHHHRARDEKYQQIKFDAVRVEWCAVEDLDAQELKLIQQYRPQKNKVMNRAAPADETIFQLPGFMDMLRRVEKTQTLGQEWTRRMRKEWALENEPVEDRLDQEDVKVLGV